MIRIPLLASIAALLAFSSQTKAQGLDKDPAAIREGASLFRANCSPCHGFNARGGGRGPDLTTGRWAHGSSDRAIFQTITQGVPGTEMPANSFEDSEVWALVAYLRSVSVSAQDKVPGNVVAGQELFFGKAGCAQCHMVRGRGGPLGPELTLVGEARPVEYLIESIREPDKDLSTAPVDPNNHYGIPLEYDTAIVVTKDGKRIEGVAKNEDAFSLQLLGQDRQLHLFLKKDLSEVRHDRRSLMPAYSEKMLSGPELRDVVAYLTSLRGEQ